MSENSSLENTPESGLPGRALLDALAEAFVNRSFEVRKQYGRTGCTQHDHRILLRADILMDISEAIRSVNNFGKESAR